MEVAVVVNQAFVRQFLKGVDPLAQRIVLGKDPSNAAVPIVGVVGDTPYTSIREGVPPTIYLSYRHVPSIGARMDVALRTHVPPASLAAAVREGIARLNPAIPVLGLRTQTEQIAESLARDRVLTTLVVSFSFLSLLLCAIGLHSVLAYAVTRRAPELGVRMALGALPRNTVWLMVRESVLLVAAGIAAGLLVGAFLSRFIESQLYGIEASDPVTYVASALMLLGAAAVAAFVPARRAARMDPATVLKAE